jgi:hypothetical protein
VHDSCSARWHPALQGAWWGQAVREGGLPQVLGWRRHVSLQGPWWGAAVPDGRLLHRGSGWHSTLHSAWGGEEVPEQGLR